MSIDGEILRKASEVIRKHSVVAKSATTRNERTLSDAVFFCVQRSCRVFCV